MIDAGNTGIELAVAGDASDRNAAEADAVIGALTPDQPRARAVAARTMISERDLQRGLDRLRARIAEEHMIKIAGQERGEARRRLENRRMAHLERRCVVEGN